MVAYLDLSTQASTYAFHPYLHADSQATTVIDSVRAARKCRRCGGRQALGQAVFTGYSQGSHASMTAYRAAEREYAKASSMWWRARIWPNHDNLSGSLQVTEGGAGRAVLCAHDRPPGKKVLRQHIYGSPSSLQGSPTPASIGKPAAQPHVDLYHDPDHVGQPAGRHAEPGP